MLPAHNCGIAGLRPTYGRVSRYGAMALSWTLDKLGPMCLTADDCGLVLEAIAGHDPNDPTTSDRPYSYDAEHAAPRRFKLGVLKGMVDAAEEEVKANLPSVAQGVGANGRYRGGGIPRHALRAGDPHHPQTPSPQASSRTSLKAGRRPSFQATQPGFRPTPGWPYPPPIISVPCVSALGSAAPPMRCSQSTTPLWGHRAIT